MSLLADGVRDALTRLTEAVAKEVSDAQRRCQLTRLPNQLALEERISDLVAGNQGFFVAFVEIDKFKSLNDKYGYETADVLLKDVASTLQHAQKFFRPGATAYRQHGDEFYMVGDCDEIDAAEIARKLDVLRGAIAEISIPTGHPTPMTCTVTVGWVLRDDLLGDDNLPVTVRRVFGAAERAVAAGKARRNTVERYDGRANAERHESIRADCAACSAKVSVDVPRTAYEAKQGDAFPCPNCGTDMTRPPMKTDVVERPQTRAISLLKE